MLEGMPPHSVDFSVFSPPFPSLFSYTSKAEDIGNSENMKGEAKIHLSYFFRGLARVLKPGRLMSVHCMNLPATKQRHGYIGLQDFRGDLIRLHTGDGFIYHSEVAIWKDPVVAMQRTKALGLLHKTIRERTISSIWWVCQPTSMRFQGNTFAGTLDWVCIALV
jgi:hypothetical protein